MKRKTLIPQPLLPNLGEGEPEISPSPYLGEGFRVRAKTTVLNIDEVYKAEIAAIAQIIALGDRSNYRVFQD